ncbi:MAG: DHHA1 domain-containing protein, partial [Chitinophagales bacterium]|nr:DHHA1 domain-containing protein [Chitinophagales bacterium]
EAIAGHKVMEYIRDKESYLNLISDALKHPQDITKSVQRLLEENVSMKMQIEQYQVAQLKQIKQQVKQSIEHHNGISFVVTQLEDIGSDAAKQLATELRQELDNAIIIFTGVSNEKPFIAVGISDDLVKTKELNAGKIVKDLATHIKGGGGGQAYIATAGGQDITGVSKVISSAKELVNKL